MNKWKRFEEIEACLRELVASANKKEIGLLLSRKYSGDEEAIQQVADIQRILIHDLCLRTGCKQATARHHVSSWLRSVYQEMMK